MRIKQLFLSFSNCYQYNARLPLYQCRWSNLPYHCAHKEKSQIGSQKLISLTGGIVEIYIVSDYDITLFVFVAISAAQNLQQVSSRFSLVSSVSKKRFPNFYCTCKLCDDTINYSQLRKVVLQFIYPSNIGCLLQKLPNLFTIN